MKLCVLVAVPGEAIVGTLQHLYDDYAAGMELFLYNDGVFLLHDPAFLELSRHVKTTVCDVSAGERNIGKLEGIVSGSLYNLSTMIAHAERFLSLARAS